MNATPPSLPYRASYSTLDYIEQIGGQKLVDCHIYIATNAPHSIYRRVFFPSKYIPDPSTRVLFELENHDLAAFTIGAE